MGGRRVSDFYLNFGHALDHLVMLIYPTAILTIGADMVGSYGEALRLSIGGFVAFGVCSLPAGWLGDRWSRHGMMVVFFIGIGVACMLTGLARTPLEIALALTLIGIFAAIYHPVGIAMLVGERDNVGWTLGINGVAGNLGVAFAALATASLAEMIHWRAAFLVPGAISIAAGIGFAVMVPKPAAATSAGQAAHASAPPQDVIRRVFCVLLVATVCGGLIFNSTTIAMPKVFDERLVALTRTTIGIGAILSVVYILAALAQLCVGYLIDRYPLRGILVAVAGFQVPLLFLAGMVEGTAMVLIAVAMMFVVFGQIPINDAIVAKYTDERWRSRAYAARYVITFAAAAAAVPLVAYLHDATGGFERTFVLLAVFAAGTLLAAFALPAGRPVAAPA